MTTRYLNVGITQVQSWLGRSPDLRGRRGASSLLATATAQAEWASVPGAKWNDEAGTVSGVVALVVEPSHDPRQVALEAIQRLRATLPGTTIQATWAEGQSYVEAYPHFEGALHDGRGLVSLPATVENITAARCERCALDRAVTSITLPTGKTYRVCEDCHARYCNSGDTSERAKQVEPITKAMEATGSLCKDMSALASSGFASHTKATRVATFYADGDAIGNFIKTAVGAGAKKETLAHTINTANEEAFLEAAQAVLATTETGHRHTVIPHLVAGDDVLASLCASSAWEFAATFLTSFGERIKAELTKQLRPGQRVDWPSASGAIVFHHMSHPLSEAIAQAEDLLRDTVKPARTSGSSLLYVDLMAESKPSAGVKESVCLAKSLPLARDVAQLPPHHRSTLAPLLRRNSAEDQREVEHIIERAGPSPLKNRSRDELLWLLQIANDIDPNGGQQS